MRRATEADFWRKVNKDGPIPAHVPHLGPCWEFTGAPKGGGYAGIRRRAENLYTVVHRYSYQLLVGPIPEGLTLDHLCKNRICVNPDHLEPVTLTENILRGDSPHAINARKTHCPKGHQYDIKGTDGRPNRGCRQCRREYAKAFALRPEQKAKKAEYYLQVEKQRRKERKNKA